MNKITQQTVKQVSKSSEAQNLYIDYSRLLGGIFGLTKAFNETTRDPIQDDFYNVGKIITCTGTGFFTGPIFIPGTVAYFISKKIGESLSH